MTEDQKIATAAAVERFNGIMASPEAVGRESSARHFALVTDLTVDEVRAALLTVPKAQDDSIGARARETIITTH